MAPSLESSVNIFVTITSRCLAGKLFSSVSLWFSSGVLSCSFIGNILLCLIVLFDLLYLFLWIRRNHYLSLSGRNRLVWEHPLCRLHVLAALIDLLELELVWAREVPRCTTPGPHCWESLSWCGHAQGPGACYNRATLVGHLEPEQGWVRGFLGLTTSVPPWWNGCC